MTIQAVEDIRQSLGKRSKITLVDKLKNVGKNIGHNILSFALPLITAGVISGTALLGKQARHKVDINRGYSQAYTQITSLNDFLKAEPSFYVNPPVSSRALNPAIDAIRQNLQINTNQHGEVSLYLTEKLQRSLDTTIPATNSSPTGVSTNTNSNSSATYSVTNKPYSNTNTNKAVNLKAKDAPIDRKKVLEEIANELKPMYTAENGYIALAVLTGVLSFLSFSLTIGCWNNSEFEDYNSHKKDLRRRYNELLTGIKKEVRDGNLTVDGSAYVGKFFAGLDLPNMQNQYLENLVAVVGQNLNNTSVDLFRAISENPRAFIGSGDIESSAAWYHNLRREDRRNPLKGSQIQSRKDLFLKLLSANAQKDPQRIGDIIKYALQQEEAGFPTFAEVLVKGSRDISGLHRAVKFLSENGREFGSLGKDMASHYLLNPDSVPLIGSDLGSLRAYANRKVSQLSLDEGMRFLLEVESFRNRIKHVDDKLKSACPSLQVNDKYDDVVDVAIDASKQSADFGAHALTLGDFTPDYRAVCPQIYHVGFIPNKYLINRLLASKDREAELASWREARDQIRAGKFDPKDKLMRSLEYTTFYKMGQSLEMDTNPRYYEGIFERAENG
jgi:hypothetical protein